MANRVIIEGLEDISTEQEKDLLFAFISVDGNNSTKEVADKLKRLSMHGFNSFEITYETGYYGDIDDFTLQFRKTITDEDKQKIKEDTIYWRKYKKS